MMTRMIVIKSDHHKTFEILKLMMVLWIEISKFLRAETKQGDGPMNANPVTFDD